MICTRERLALATVLAAAELGLRIPDDLSLISLEDGEQLASDLVPAVATIQRPDSAMAEEAVALLLRELNSERTPTSGSCRSCARPSCAPRSAPARR